MRGLAHGAWLKARKYAVAGSAALRERTAYRGSFLGSALAYALFIFVFSRIWGTAFADRTQIAGYGRAQLIWYFIVAEIPTFAFSGSFWSLAQDMKSGQVAYLLSRPYSFVAYSCAQGLGRALANALVLLAEGLSLGLLTAGPPPLGSAIQALLALAAALLAGLILFLLQLAIAMTAFWVEENAAFYWIFQKLALIVGTLMPLEFLPDAARAAAWWTPFPALSYVPARIFVAWQGTAAGLGLLGFQLVWLVLAALLCQGIYALGRARLTVNGG
jgi:ABC-2 type transport system permease protein